MNTNSRYICNTTPGQNDFIGPRLPNGIEERLAAEAAARKANKDNTPKADKPINPRYICRIPGINC